MEQIGLCLASSTRRLQQAGRGYRLIAGRDSRAETNQYCFYGVQVEDLLTFTLVLHSTLDHCMCLTNTNNGLVVKIHFKT